MSKDEVDVCTNATVQTLGCYILFNVAAVTMGINPHPRWS